MDSKSLVEHTVLDEYLPEGLELTELFESTNPEGKLIELSDIDREIFKSTIKLLEERISKLKSKSKIGIKKL